MQLAKVLVPIQRDVVCTVQAEVGEHEIEVLKAVHGEKCLADNILPTPEMHSFDTIEEEFDRLLRLYGAGTNGVPYVVQAYGNPHEFKRQIQALLSKRK